MQRSIMPILTICLSFVCLPIAALAQMPVVKLHTVTEGGGEMSRVFFGRVAARETVDLAFQAGGQILDFPLEEGAYVAEGGLVARLDLVPFELALEEATVQNSQANRTLARYEKLLGTTISETTVQDAETQVKLTAIAISNAERALEHATLHAPFDALVSERLVPNFSTVSAGTPVVRLHDMSDLRIEIDVPETLFQKAGHDPDILIFASFPGNDTEYPVEFREFTAETASVGQTYRISLGMTPPDGVVILPGASAKVTVVFAGQVSRIEIPASAVIVGGDGKARVMVFNPTGALEGTLTETEIEIVPTDRGAVEVVSGLEPGQEIVAVGGAVLDDGTDVKRFTGFGN